MTRLGPFLIFLSVALLLVGGLHYYAWARLVRDPQLPPGLSRALGAGLVLLAVTLVVSPILSRVLPRESLRPLYWGAYLWMGMGLLVVGLLALTDLGRLFAGGAIWLSQKLSDTISGPADPSRRVLLSRALAATVGAAAAGLSAFGVRSALGDIHVKEVPIKLPRLPEALRGLKVVQISDVHIGALLRRDWLERVVERVQSLAPDLIAITGDLVDGSVRDLAAHVQPLASLKAPRGVFFVTGNHDFYSGAREWCAHLETLGVRPLKNECVPVAPGLDVAGVHDWSSRGSDSAWSANLKTALERRDPNAALVLLAHQPRQFAEAAEAGVHLQLSGHTHGGQIWPFSWFVYLAQPFVAGLHKKGDSQLYVSRGTGFWGPPLRVGAPAEITLLRLEPA